MKTKYEKIICAFMLIYTSIVAVFSTPVLAEEAKPITVLVDDVQIQFDAEPIIENGHTLVPMRPVFEALGTRVHWNGEERWARAVRDSIVSYTTLTITIDSEEMPIESEQTRRISNNFDRPARVTNRSSEVIHLDVPARLINGKTFVPLRAVSEGLGAQVEWDAVERRVSITSEKSDGALAIPKDNFLIDLISESVLTEDNGESIVITANGPNPYFVLFEWIFEIEHALNYEIKYIAVDMSEAKAQDYSTYISLMKAFCDKNGLILLEDTREGLIEKDIIKSIPIEDSERFFYHFEEGILITFEDSFLSEDKLVTNITKWQSSLGAIGGNYTLEKIDGVWLITDMGGIVVS